MLAYNYYDTDQTGFAELDIEGEHYLELLEICFYYCASFSWRIRGKGVTEPGNICQFQIPVTSNVVNAYSHFYHQDSKLWIDEVRHYKIVPETIRAFRSVTDSIFKWINGWGNCNPEDPIFYRKDGSVFFSSVIHEGKCTLLPNSGEDVNEIFKYGNWVKCEV